MSNFLLFLITFTFLTPLAFSKEFLECTLRLDGENLPNHCFIQPITVKTIREEPGAPEEHYQAASLEINNKPLSLFALLAFNKINMTLKGSDDRLSSVSVGVEAAHFPNEVMAILSLGRKGKENIIFGMAYCSIREVENVGSDYCKE